MTKQEFKLRFKSAESVARTSMIFTVLTAASWVLGFVLMILGAYLPGNTDDLLHLILFNAGFGLIGFMFIAAWLANRRERQYVSGVIAELAHDNNLSHEGRRKPQYDARFMPAIAEVGMFARDVASAEGLVGDHVVTISAHTFVTWTIYYERTHMVYVKVDFDQVLPHIVLQSREGAGSKFVKSLGRTFDDNQRISLQNNLDDYFLFYTHRRTVTDALSILSPQLLEQLRNLNCSISMETIGKSAYFYMGLPDAFEMDLDTNMKFINKTVAAIDRRTKTNFFKLPNDEKYPFLRSRPTGGVVELSGKYFNYAAIGLTAQYVWNVARTFLNTDSDLYPHRWWVVGVGGALTAAAIWYLLVARSKYTKTKERRGY